jgi:2-methylcitrate dehydratase PrpD
MQHATATLSKATVNVSRFLQHAKTAALSEDVIEKTKLHIVDTIAAIISGAKLEVGRHALQAIPAFSGKMEATVIGRMEGMPAFAAAMINAMLAHADETDDSHEMSKFHPGCAIVPTALAIAQRDRLCGADVLRGVAGGYDVGARVLEAIGPIDLHRSGHSTHACGSLFGAGATASILMGFDMLQAQRLVSYLVQELSGVVCWMEDRDHVQKAYVFGGMPVKNAVIAASLVACGWTGVDEVLLGANRLLPVFGQSATGRRLEAPFRLGEEILRSNIKKWCVGSPAQAALDCLEALANERPIELSDIEQITVELPSFEAHVVDNRDMPNINLQHLCSIYLKERQLTFEAAHDYARFQDPTLITLRSKIKIVPSETLQQEGGRQAIVTIRYGTGTQRQHRTRHVRGTWGNPMPRAEVSAKAEQLIAPILGAEGASRLHTALWRLESLSASELAELLRTVAL